jgi:hypothetical protein
VVAGNAALLCFVVLCPANHTASLSRQAIAEAIIAVEELLCLPWYLLYTCE